VTAPAVTVARPTARPWQIWTALAIVYVVWGSTYLAIRVLVEDVPAMISGGLRFLLAGLIMMVVVAARAGVVVDRRQLLWTAVCGCLLVTGGNGLVMVAEQSIASGVAALIIAMVPVWVVLMRRATGEAVSGVTMAGVAFGFAGVALLLLPGGGGHSEPLGFVLLLSASLSWATGSFFSSRVTLPANPFLSTAFQMIFGGLLSIAIGVAFGEVGQVSADSFTTDAVIAWAYLVLIGSLVAFTAYVWLLQNAPISRVATYAYVNPMIAIGLGAVVLSEDVTLTILAGAAIIVGSVAIVIRQESA
jgi:drug/metabolite transporter (DMT)-like permease